MSEESIAIQIERWKKQYKEVLKVHSDDEVAYLKRPTLLEMDRYNEVKNSQDEYQALDYLFKQCVLEEKEYDDEFLLSAGKSLIQQSLIDQNKAINRETGKDEIKKSAALVRHYFHVDPYELPMNEFQKLLSEALWLQEHKNKQLELVLANVLVKTFANSTI